jgi:ATP-dependent DNA helicase RecQ
MFVFLSPERFQIDGFRQILMGLSFNKSIERIVLDEVHCLSEWGHDFRIPYLMLADTLKTYCGDNVKYLGLTATAAASVINDLIVELRMQMKDVIFLNHCNNLYIGRKR